MSTEYFHHTTEINRLATQAQKSCGLSHSMYIQHLSKSIDNYVKNMDDSEKSNVIDEAILFGYASSDEIRQMLLDHESNGYCCHGISIDCCPAGCGDIISGDVS